MAESHEGMLTGFDQWVLWPSVKELRTQVDSGSSRLYDPGQAGRCVLLRLTFGETRELNVMVLNPGSTPGASGRVSECGP